ncbi:hypothetical protein [Streptomyces sp. NPDC001286]
MNYQTHHGVEPTDQELSTHLATQGLLGRDHQPISPANLRRHFLRWRIYNLWANHRARTLTPSLTDIAAECARHGITAQYNKPINPNHITHLTPDFERRWQTLNPRHASEQGPSV